MDKLETRSVEERENYQFTKLNEIFLNAKKCSKGWNKILKDINFDKISDRSFLQKLPITRKSSLSKIQAESPPFGDLTTIATNEFKNIFVSPGPIYEPGGDQDFWRMSRAMNAAGFKKGEILYNTFSYHLTPAGQMMEQGGEKLGMCVIPGGIGNTEQQLSAIENLKPDRYVGTPSFLKMLLDSSKQKNIDISFLKTGLVGGEACPPSLSAILKELGCPVLQSYGTADLGLVAYETWDDDGMFCDEDVIVEIIRPGSDEVLENGEVGELVVTTLNPFYPLFRFATGDLSAVMTEKSNSGRTAMRIKGWMGRADQTTKVRGMFVRPEQIAKIVNASEEIIKARLVVGNVDHKDTLKLFVETINKDEKVISSIEEQTRSELKLRAEIELVDSGSLVNDGLVIEDTRTYE